MRAAAASTVRRFARISAAVGSIALLSLAACNGTTSVSVPPPQPSPAGAPTLYAYSPDETALVATYPAAAKGRTSPSTVLAGKKTRFRGGKANLFGGGIFVAPDGTLYVFDAVRALVLTFAPGARGDVPPAGIERLPSNANARLHVPQYAGFAPDGSGSFWTADRSNGNMLRFPLGSSGSVKPLATLKPSVLEGRRFVPGVASVVASDGMGSVYCVCQPDDLALQLYCITQYDVTGKTPKIVWGIYGIAGNLDTQIPSSVLHVDPETKTAYVGIWKPAAVFEYRLDAPEGPAPAPHVIGGVATTLASVPAAIATDTSGRVYVAQGSAILVFDAGVSGNVKPARIIADRAHLHFLGYAYGDLLRVR